MICRTQHGSQVRWIYLWLLFGYRVNASGPGRKIDMKDVVQNASTHAKTLETAAKHGTCCFWVSWSAWLF